MRKNLRLLSNILLLFTALIWGVAFVAQSIATDSIGPWTFVFCRFLIAGVLLLPLTAYTEKTLSKPMDPRPVMEKEKHSLQPALLGGSMVGIFLGLASVLQQQGLAYTTVGKAGFITALYIIMVPIFGLLFRQRPSKTVWISAIIAVIGFYFIAMKKGEGFQISMGDGLVLCSSILYSCQILTIDHFSVKVHPVLLSNIEFLVAALVGLIGMLLFEQPSWEALQAAAIPILYAGVFSSAVGYTLQIVAQRYTEPTVASLLMSMESVFSALAGWVILRQGLNRRELLGCGLVFFSVILAQLPDRREKA